jgi:hypothetical protein
VTDKTIEKAIKNAIKLLMEIYPKNTHLYFPLLSAALVWIVRRPKEWEENIFSWQVWPNPDYIEAKPDDFILGFFSSRALLQKAFAEEIRNKDWAVLRTAFIRLYPIFGLEDPFLMALFQEEIEAENISKIVSEFDAKIESARKDIQVLKGDNRLLAGLRAFADEMASLGTALLVESEVQKSLREILEKQLKGTDE